MLGLTVLYSASAQDMGLVSKQAMSFGIGFLVMCGLAQIPPKVYQAFAPYFYLFGLVCLVAVKVFGEVRMGAQRWIGIPGFGSVQPKQPDLGTSLLILASGIFVLFLSEADALGTGWNIIQSKTAIGSGGFMGKEPFK
ncbi:unnamed protein product [Oppiella nova]|uniref:Peptidoglycan glycosyltransferase n=1 Tax=Oppiella nova TaxID=334625 RepID=A0A7R9L8S3_9ACAR|nr:unnamed protein product [Oppiella nova]CAG2159489.1 unnamed protein product [Oppiella nova]